MSTENHEYEIDGEVISSKNGAEIFNDYQHNIALGDYSHAQGLCTIAASDEQHVQGKYNIKDTENKYAFIIGNGTDNNDRSNAIAIDWDGNIICYGDKISINEQVDNNTRKLSGIDDNANNYIHPTHTSHSKSMYKFANDELGHVSDAEPVTKDDIVELGIPGQDTNTTYSIYRFDADTTYNADIVHLKDSNGSLKAIFNERDFLPLFYSTNIMSHKGNTVYKYKKVFKNIRSGSAINHFCYICNMAYIIYDGSGDLLYSGNVKIILHIIDGTLKVYAYTDRYAYVRYEYGLSSDGCEAWFEFQIFDDRLNQLDTTIAHKAKITCISTFNDTHNYMSVSIDFPDPSKDCELIPENGDTKDFYNQIDANTKKLDNIADNANNYVHPTTSGNKHIPSGGSSGQILRWLEDGTAIWGEENDTEVESISNIDLENMLK